MNIQDRESLDPVFSKHKPDAVMHLAAESHVDRSIDEPSDFVETNITGTFNILELIKIHKIEHTLIASTSSVYGSNTEIPFSENQKTETQISFLRPMSANVLSNTTTPVRRHGGHRDLWETVGCNPAKAPGSLYLNIWVAESTPHQEIKAARMSPAEKLPVSSSSHPPVSC